MKEFYLVNATDLFKSVKPAKSIPEFPFRRRAFSIIARAWLVTGRSLFLRYKGGRGGGVAHSEGREDGEGVRDKLVERRR